MTDTLKEKLAEVSQEDWDEEQVEKDRQFAKSVSSFGSKLSLSVHKLL